jgi:uncharacterized delta-60 repeat protein
MSFMLLGILNSQAAGGAWGGVYYLSSLAGANTVFARGVVTDSSSNVYTIAYATGQGAGSYDILVAKYDATGVIQWQRNLGGTSTEKGSAIAVDSNDNIYVCGYSQSGTSLQDWLIVKYNSSGTLQWQKRLAYANAGEAASISIDSSDNIYLCGDLNIGSSYQLAIAKYNTAGTIQWDKTLGDSGTEAGTGIATDSAGNFWVTGFDASTTEYDIMVVKYNSSGTVQVQRRLSGSSSDFGRGVATDSNNNVYVIGETYSDGAGSGDFIIAKYNSSGTIQWQRNLGNNQSQEGLAIATDSNDNVYVTGGSDGAMLIAKYNSSGTIQWQRTFSFYQALARGIHLDSNDILYVIGEGTTLEKNQMLFKIPSDGSLTDSYTLDGATITYAASSLTDQVAALTASTTSWSGQTQSRTNNNPSLTDQTSSLTEHFAGIG